MVGVEGSSVHIVSRIRLSPFVMISEQLRPFRMFWTTGARLVMLVSAAFQLTWES